MTSASFALVGFDPGRSAVPQGARPEHFAGARCPVETTVGALRDRLADLAAASRTACVVALLDADDTMEAVRMRGALNEAVLTSESLLVPCVVTDPWTAYLGPWMKPPSTPCLGCFAPDLLPAGDGFRLDEVRHPPAGPGRGAHGRTTASDDGPAKPDELAALALGEAFGTLRHGLAGSPDRSVWGRVLSLHLRANGTAVRESWRVPRDPDCRWCGTPVCPGAPPLPRLSRILHENSKLHDHFKERDAINSAYATEPVPRPSGNATASADRAKAPGTAHPLPDVRATRSLPLEEAITRRRSRRRFGLSALTLDELSALLHYSSGVTGWATTTSGGRVPLRAAPSGGALYPLDVYAYVRRVSGLPRGLYRYDPTAHALVGTGRPADAGEALSAHSAHGGVLDDAAVVVLLAASFRRVQAKYLERGYRIALMEAGHIAQNLQLVAAARQLRACGVTGFVDDVVNGVLGVAPRGESQALYLLALGRAPATATGGQP
uniref:Cyclodehydratase-oxidoreductase n=1 Tax=Streptomyces nobilis TaxID=66901 RepID=I2CMF2_9ACTN|nr:cyclodehydratase-oxidoreductase [Streptomyces nobilis]